MQYRMDHMVLHVDDVEKMMAFYTEILMMPAERLEEYWAGQVAFISVRLNQDTIIDLFPKKLWQEIGKSAGEIGNLNHFCVVLEKSDWEALAEERTACAPEQGQLDMLAAVITPAGQEEEKPRSRFNPASLASLNRDD